MTINELCDILNAELVVRYYPNQGCRWTASMNGAETKTDFDDRLLCSTHGNGSSPEHAIEEYVANIRGRVIVLNAGNPERRMTIAVPTTLTVPSPPTDPDHA
jgi:hypothetical protein